jgi:tRNA modification GTPase
VVDGAVLVEGVTVRIMDGAGLGIPRDSVDAEGMMRSRRAIDESDLVVVVLDRSRPRTVADEEVLHLGSNRPRLVIANKSDLPAAWPDDGVDCVCSALNELGIEGLRKCLAAWVRERLSTDAEEGGMVASLRVIGRLKEAQIGLDLAGAGLGTGMPLEAVLIDLRVALSALDETLGCQADDAVLDRIFATFCVGK